MKRKRRKGRRGMTFKTHLANILGGLKRRGMSSAECGLVKKWLPYWVLDHRCAYCACKLYGNTFSLDHVEPLSRGGENRQRNLALSCDPCNRAKGSLSGTEFCALMALLGSLGTFARTNVLARLKAAGRFYHR